MALFFIMKYQLLIIDGYNLLHQDVELSRFLNSSLEGARKQLINKVARIAPTVAKKCVIVFDGKSESRGVHRAKEENIELLFSSRHQTADTIIERITHCSTRPEKICVVTSDNAEQTLISSAGAFWMSCDTFLRESSYSDSQASGYIKTQSLIPRNARLGDFFPDIK